MLNRFLRKSQKLCQSDRIPQCSNTPVVTAPRELQLQLVVPGMALIILWFLFGKGRRLIRSTFLTPILGCRAVGVTDLYLPVLWALVALARCLLGVARCLFGVARRLFGVAGWLFVAHALLIQADNEFQFVRRSCLGLSQDRVSGGMTFSRCLGHG